MGKSTGARLVLLQDLHDDAYDIEVDTTTTESDENADQIVQYLVRQDAELAETRLEPSVWRAPEAQR